MKDVPGWEVSVHVVKLMHRSLLAITTSWEMRVFQKLSPG